MNERRRTAWTAPHERTPPHRMNKAAAPTNESLRAG
jgi:hypothetical protein